MNININSSANNYFRSTVQIGIHQKVERKSGFDLPGGILLWKAMGKVLLWALPVILSLNLLFSSLIDSKQIKIEEMEGALSAIEANNMTLRAERAQLASPDNVKVAAAEKLSLYEPAPGQVHRM